jgi:hypothetical protein
MIGAVFMLMIMITALLAIIFAYNGYNQATSNQRNDEYLRARESIAISAVNVNSQTNTIKNITVSNIGAIEVKIKALYLKQGGTTTFEVLPSTITNSYIPIDGSKSIDLTSLNLPATNAKLIVATERGVKSQGINLANTSSLVSQLNYDSSLFRIGPLMLVFTSLDWTSTFIGNNPSPPWQSGWIVPSGQKIAWRVNVTDVDPQGRDLTLNQYSGFTINKYDGTQTTTWYLKPNSITLNWNQSAIIMFMGDSPGSNSASKITSGTGVNNAFLTLFGTYGDGKTFAQTIPFESITVT